MSSWLTPEPIETAMRIERPMVLPRANLCFSKKANEVSKSIYARNCAYIPDAADAEKPLSLRRQEELSSALLASLELAPAQFADDSATFEECRYNEIDLEPHPAFDSTQAFALDKPSVSRLKAEPLYESAHHTILCGNKQ